jgi:hypothetical protein
MRSLSLRIRKRGWIALGARRSAVAAPYLVANARFKSRFTFGRSPRRSRAVSTALRGYGVCAAGAVGHGGGSSRQVGQAALLGRVAGVQVGGAGVELQLAHLGPAALVGERSARAAACLQAVPGNGRELHVGARQAARAIKPRPATP